MHGEDRNKLLKHNGVRKEAGDDYRNVIQKAFYTYRCNDERFEQTVREMLKIHAVLQQKIYVAEKLPEFERDPYEMGMDEFQKWYDTLVEKYQAAASQTIEIGQLLSKMAAQKDAEEEEGEVEGAKVTEVKEEEKQEEIEPIESYSSLDRKLRESAKKEKKAKAEAEAAAAVDKEEKKDLGTAEKVMSEVLPAAEGKKEEDVAHLHPIEEPAQKPQEEAKLAEKPEETHKIVEVLDITADKKVESVAVPMSVPVPIPAPAPVPAAEPAHEEKKIEEPAKAEEKPVEAVPEEKKVEAEAKHEEKGEEKAKKEEEKAVMSP